MSEKNYSTTLEHALNKRNPFQLLRAEEIAKRVQFTLEQQQKFDHIKTNNIKPVPNNFDNIIKGSFFNEEKVK